MELFAEDLLAWEVPADAATAPEREEPPKEDARAAGAGINAVRMANKDAGALRANLNPGAARAKTGNPAPLNLGAARGRLENHEFLQPADSSASRPAAQRSELNPGATRARTGNHAPLNLGAARGRLENREFL